MKKKQVRSNKLKKTKLNRIHEIENNNGEVERIILNYKLTEEQAFACEAAVINCLKLINPNTLTNEQSGHHCTKAITDEELELLFGAKPLSKEYITDNVVVIKINKLYKLGMPIDEIKEITRGHWVIDIKKAAKANFVFAVYRGLIVGVFKPIEWYDSKTSRVDFPRSEETGSRDLDKRKYFTCEIVDSKSVAGKKYLHKSIKDFSKATQNPVFYIFNKGN